MTLRDYEVLYIERGQNTVYICRRSPESKLYRVIETADRMRIAKYIKYFAAFKPREFCEDFCLDEKYYVVFLAPDGIPLKYSDGILTAEKIVRALAMQNPPPEISVNILSPDHIFVCGNELEFAYDLPEIETKVSWEDFFYKLAEFVKPFLETGADSDAEKWLADLRSGGFEDLLTVYRCIPDTSEETALSDKEPFKKIKAVLPKIAAVIAVAAVIITVVVLVINQRSEDFGYGGMDSLGTIDLTKK